MTRTTTHSHRLGPQQTRLGFAGVLRSEWIKLRTLRSTVWSYLFVIVLTLGMALVMSLTIANGMGGEMDARGMPDAAQTELFVQSSVFGVYLAQLVVAVLGVLVVTGEYSTGMIRSTLAAVPTRLPALAAKAAVLFVATFVVGVVSTVGAYFVSTAVYSGYGLSASITDSDVFMPLLGAALYLALLAVFALGVGTMVRSSAGGIGIVLALILVVPVVLQMIPADWAQSVVPYLLSDAGTSMFAPESMTGGDSMGAWQSLLVVLGWVAASATGAAVLLTKRDA
ncbi:ABC transporter permease [Agromyces sp. Marseille-P2726]|uniref:ABC transporter permease n=1 Tax=Agromyces sp. Marseille-P2726 TaxID=2709132 RepID=UPI00156F8ED0|nr:ABC transporter permease [Agromyces sp. Marseille-P2726]